MSAEPRATSVDDGEDAEGDTLAEAAGSEDLDSDQEEDGRSSKKRKRRSALACNVQDSKAEVSDEWQGTSSKLSIVRSKGSCYVLNLELRVAELEAAIIKYNPLDPLVNDHLRSRSGSINPSTNRTPLHRNGDSSLTMTAMSARSPTTPLGTPTGNTNGASTVSPMPSPAHPESNGNTITSQLPPTSQQPNSTGHPSTVEPAPVQSLHSSGIQMENSDGGRRGKVKDEIAAGVALLSLNSSAEAHYLGGSSGFSWAKVILGTLDQPQTERVPSGGERFLSQPILLAKTKTAPPNERPMIPTTEVTSALVDAFYLHIQARYPFMDYVALKDWLARRGEIIPAADSVKASKKDRIAAFFIWLTFAVGSRLLQQSNLPGVSAPETYYVAALRHLEIITALHNVENIQAFLLMAMYSFRCTEGPSAWHLVGISLRMCIDLGMHRRNPVKQKANPYREEVKRRVFWTTYGLDRMLAVSLGRPLGLDERDVDQPLPRNLAVDSVQVPLDDDSMELDLNPDHFDYAKDAEHFTTMSSALHILKLRILESRIQRTIYRVDRPSRLKEAVRPDVDKALAELERWVKACPLRPSGPQWARIPCCSPDWWLHRYEECRLLLLRPLTAGAMPGDPYLVKLAQSAANLCQLHLRLHQTPPIAHSLTALHSIFLSGLTLLHAVQNDPMVIPMGDSSRAIRACSTTLFVYAQHFAAAEPFRDAFEDLATASAEGAHDRRIAQQALARSQAIPPPDTLRLQPTEWVGDLSGWMRSADSQSNFLSLLATMGYAPDVRVIAPQMPALAIAPTPGMPAVQDPLHMLTFAGTTPAGMYSEQQTYNSLGDGTQMGMDMNGNWYPNEGQSQVWSQNPPQDWSVQGQSHNTDIYGQFHA